MSGEAFNPSPLLDPRKIMAAVTLDDAAELVDQLLECNDPDDLADLLEHIVDKTDRAHAVLFALLARLRGWDTGTGVQIVAATTRGPQR